MRASDIAIATQDPIYGLRTFTLGDAEYADLVELGDLVNALMAEHDALAALID